MDGGEVLGRLVPALLLVVAAPLVLRHFVRKSKGMGGGDVRVVARAPIGRSVAAVIVQSGQRRFLLGVTESSVGLISELDSADEDTYYSSGMEAGSPHPITGPRTGLERWRQLTLRRSPREQVRVLSD